MKGQRGNSPVPPCPRSPQKPTCHPRERTTQVPSSLKAEPSKRGAWGSHGCQLSRIKVSMTAEKVQCESDCHMNVHVELCLHNMPQRERWRLRAWSGSKPSSLLPKGSLPVPFKENIQQASLLPERPPARSKSVSGHLFISQTPRKAVTASPASLTSTTPCAPPIW